MLSSFATALVFTFICMVGSAATAQQRVEVDRILVVVNDEPITSSDLETFRKKLDEGGLIDSHLVPDDETRQVLLKDRAALLQKLIDAELIDSEVQRQGLAISSDRIEQEIRTIARGNKMRREDLQAALEARGVDFAEYQDFIRIGLERQGVIEKNVTSRIKVSEDDVMARLMESGAVSSSKPFEYEIAQILFLNSKRGPDIAKARADQAMQKLSDGVPFERVAADYSDDPDFEIGGVIAGSFKSGELPKALEKELSGLAVGKWTRPQPTEQGLRIVRLLKKSLLPDAELEAKKNVVRAQLGEAVFKRQYKLWVEQMRSEAFIHRNDSKLE